MTRIGKFYHFLPPEILRDIAFIPIMNKVYYSFIQIRLRFWLDKSPPATVDQIWKKFESVKNDVKENWTANREDLGTGLGCFGSNYKMAEHFTRFARRK